MGELKHPEFSKYFFWHLIGVKDNFLLLPINGNVVFELIVRFVYHKE